MAWLECKFKSKALMGPVKVRVYLPVEEAQQIQAVFTLLHGFTNDGDDWVFLTSAVRYARENQVALIVPDAANSFYHDMVYGGAYYTWLTQEMPALLRKTVQLPWEREKQFVCGFSMGGYGALLLGLSQPERYAGCASFSGAVAPQLMLEQAQDERVQVVFTPVYGKELILPEERNLFHLARRVAALDANQQPKVLCTTGKQDFEPYYIYQQNQMFLQQAEQCGLKLSYLEWDGGHDWIVWDRSLVYAMDAFVNPGYNETVLQGWRSDVTKQGG